MTDQAVQTCHRIAFLLFLSFTLVNKFKTFVKKNEPFDNFFFNFVKKYVISVLIFQQTFSKA